MSRITKTITYNLNDTGRKHTGQDRSNVDVQAMIRRINSPDIQEQVDAGVLHGFCGHQIRQRYGMIPPESVEINGQIILLEPATRTVYLHADNDGTVHHKQEFYENKTGEHVFQQYKAKIGGFSTACNYIVDGLRLLPNIFGGFDYVFSQNFLENASIGLFDSAQGTEAMPLIQTMLEYEIVALYDSVEASSLHHDCLNAMSQRAREAERELKRLKLRTARRVQRAKQISVDEYDSALCSGTRNFKDEMVIAQSFMNFEAEVEKKSKPITEDEKAKGVVDALGSFMGFK